MDFSKEAQTKKNRKVNPKKMPKTRYKQKCIWLFSAFPICQICHINKSDQAHHAMYGYRGRNDYTIIAVCEPCHTEIHHGTNGVDVSRDDLEALGFETHDEWEQSNG